MPYFCVRTHASRPRKLWNPIPPPVERPAEEIARLAYSYWEARGCQGGSPEEDWYRAEREWDERHGRP